ncbi:MAG: S24/S26 family peptidase [Acidobacteriota bacterium]|nr:S24/S26 family peptidase [Acidobacteriota bacterium]
MDAATQRVAACCELILEVVRSKGEVRLKLFGTSMLPAVWPGDLVVVRCCVFGELQLGQIILHERAGALTAHRIVKILRNRLILRGDTVPQCDPPVLATEVVGKVASVVRNGREISLRRRFAHRAVAFAVRRSSICRRMTLRLGSGLWV